MDNFRMKRFKLILLCLFCFGNTYAQGVKNNGHSVVVEIIKKGRRIFSVVEVNGFEEGDSSYVKSLKKNITKSIGDGNDIKKGKYAVLVKFIVSKDGNLSDIFCEKDPGLGLCEKVVRVVKKFKKWIPVQKF